MRYEIITIDRYNTNNKVVATAETREEAIAKVRKQQKLFTRKHAVRDTETNEIINVTNVYYGNTKVYRGNYIKMY